LRRKYNPLNPPFLRGTLKIPLRKGGKGVVFCVASVVKVAELLPLMRRLPNAA